MTVILDCKPCPFCAQRLTHIGSWALSYNPPKLHHEWWHPPVKCYFNLDAGDKLLFSTTDDPQMQIDKITQWNMRDGE